MSEKLPKCHVCGNPKEPYEVYLKNDLLSIMNHERQHKEAREGGEICQRCDSYHAMTGILKEPTDTEFKEAREKVKDRNRTAEEIVYLCGVPEALKDRYIRMINELVSREAREEYAKGYKDGLLDA